MRILLLASFFLVRLILDTYENTPLARTHHHNMQVLGSMVTVRQPLLLYLALVPGDVIEAQRKSSLSDTAALHWTTLPTVYVSGNSEIAAVLNQIGRCAGAYHL